MKCCSEPRAIRVRLRAVLTLLLLAYSSTWASETTWERNAAWLKAQINSCVDGTDPDACRRFPARTLHRLFGIDQLCEMDSCVNPWRIAEMAVSGDGWSLLGLAEDQDVLTKAQQMANGGLPVIAVHGGMVALVMPGKLFPSQAWMRNVPLAVGARVDEPSASVYAKGLSFLFSSPDSVTLYVHM